MDYALEILEDELNEICQMQYSPKLATDEITFKQRIISLNKAIEKVKKLNIDDVSKRLFSVSYLGRDERGEIVKGVEIVAESEEHAMRLIKEINNTREIYI